MNEPSAGMGTAQILRIVIFFALIVAMVWLLYAIRSTLAPFFFAFVLSYLLMPLVNLIESYRVNRMVAVVAVLITVFAIVVIPLIVVAPVIVRSTEDMVEHIVGEQGTWYCALENTGDAAVTIDRFESELEDFKVDGLPLKLAIGGRDAESAVFSWPPQASPKVGGGRDTLRVVFSPQTKEPRQAFLRLYGFCGGVRDSIVLALEGNREDVSSVSDSSIVEPKELVQFGASQILISATRHTFGQYKPGYLAFVKIYIETLHAEFENWMPMHKEWMPLLGSRDLLHAVNARLQSIATDLFKETPRLVGQLLSGLTFFVIVPFVLFFFLGQGRTIKRAIIEWVPNRHFELVLNLVHRIDTQLGGYVRGMVLSVMIVSLLSSIGLYFIGLEHFLLIGVLAGLANVIPYLGPIIGIVAGIIATVLQYSALSFDAVLPVVLVFLVVQIIDNVFVAPIVVARSVNLHPLLVIFAVLVGSELFGAVGMLLAVPTTAVIKVSVRTIYDGWRNYSV